MGIKEEIREFGKSIGIDLIGFTTAQPFDITQKVLEDSINNGFGLPHLNRILLQRCTPRKRMPQARSIISVAMSYNISPEHFPSRPDAPFLGFISKHAVGMNYQRVLREKLFQVARFINKFTPVKYRIFAGGSSMVDRAIAQRAGIGWSGANTCLYTIDYGSWVFLGNMLIDLEIEPDRPIENQCKECYRCVTACPTGALVKPNVIDPYRCLSYITQMEGYISEEFRISMGKKIFGCDTCQQVCPQNRQAIPSDHPEFMPLIDPSVDLISLLRMDKEEFGESFEKTVIGLGNRDIILRNAVIALGNYRDNRAANVLKEVLHQHVSPVVRDHAIWALSQISRFD